MLSMTLFKGNIKSISLIKKWQNIIQQNKPYPSYSIDTESFEKLKLSKEKRKLSDIRISLIL